MSSFEDFQTLPLSLYVYIYISLSLSLSLFSSLLFSFFLLSLSTYIYIYVEESKLGPKIAFFWVKTWSKFSLFFFFCFSEIFFFLQGEWDFLKKNEQKKTKNTIFWVKTWSNFVAQHTWTKFWLNLRPSFDSTFLLILGYFYLFEKMLKPLFL